MRRAYLGRCGHVSVFIEETVMTPLGQRMLDALVLRGMAQRTQQSSPEQLNAGEGQRYLLHLLRERQLARASVTLTRTRTRRAAQRPPQRPTSRPRAFRIARVPR